MKTLTYKNSDFYKITDYSIAYPGLTRGNQDYSNNVFYYDGKYYVVMYNFQGIELYGSATVWFFIDIWETDLTEVTPGNYFSLNSQTKFTVESYDGPTGSNNMYYFSNDIYLHSHLDADGVLHCIISDLDYGDWVIYKQLTLVNGVFVVSGGDDITSDVPNCIQNKFTVFKSGNTKYLALISEASSGAKSVLIYTVGSSLTLQQTISLGDTGTGTYAVAIDYDHNGDGTTLVSTDIWCAWATYSAFPSIKIYYTKLTKSGSSWSVGSIVDIDTGVDFYNWGMTDFFSCWTGEQFLITTMLVDGSYTYTFGHLIKVNSDLTYVNHVFPTQGNTDDGNPYLFRIQLTHKGSTIYPIQHIGYDSGGNYNEGQWAIPCTLSDDTITWGEELDLDEPFTGSYYGVTNAPDAPDVDLDCFPRHVVGGKFFAAGVHYVFPGAV
jgi:hypothetical protein